MDELIESRGQNDEAALFCRSQITGPVPSLITAPSSGRGQSFRSPDTAVWART
jgi:hypothetical protein